MCVGQLVAEEQHVVAQTLALQLRHAALKRRVVQQAGHIGLVLHDMAKAAQRRVLRPVFQPFLELRRAQIRPAHHAEYAGVIGGELEQKIGFLLHAAGLYRDAGRDACRVHRLQAVAGQKILLQHRHAVADPAEVLRLVAPVMLVRVDFHRGLNWYSARDAAFISIEKPGACGGM